MYSGMNKAISMPMYFAEKTVEKYEIWGFEDKNSLKNSEVSNFSNQIF